MSTHLKLYLYIIAIGLMVMLGAGVALGAFVVAPTMAARAQSLGQPTDAEAQYHRGLYDVCRSVLGGSRDQCLGAVAEAQSKHWYDQASDGWSWPPAAGSQR